MCPFKNAGARCRCLVTFVHTGYSPQCADSVKFRIAEALVILALTFKIVKSILFITAMSLAEQCRSERFQACATPSSLIFVHESQHGKCSSCQGSTRTSSRHSANPATTCRQTSIAIRRSAAAQAQNSALCRQLVLIPDTQD